MGTRNLRKGVGRPPKPPKDPLYTLNTAQAARVLGISRRELQLMRERGEGPRYAKIGRYIRYNYLDVLDYYDSGWAMDKLIAKFRNG